MRIPRYGIAYVAFILGLHVLMLAGLDAGRHGHGTDPPCAVAHLATPAAAETAVSAEATPRSGLILPTFVCEHDSVHDMLSACLAVLTGLAIVHAIALLPRGFAPVVRRLRRWAAPVLRPPTPPPIAFGVQRK